MKLFPLALKPLVGKITTMMNRYHYRKCAELLVPFFTQKITAWNTDTESLPQDFSSWSIKDAMKRKNKNEQTPDMLSRRLMTLNFAAIHTSTMTTVNLVLDIVSAPPQQHCLEDILAESEAIHQRYQGKWSRARIADMKALDSALRESMRISGFGSKVFSRKVTSPDGVFLPNGTHLRQGVTVCISGYSMHHDKSIYPDPFQFQYDRFMQSSRGEVGVPHKAATTTEPVYGIWGHGKHACPGRFFAVDMIKMIVASLIRNFEIKQLPQRPGNVWIGDTPIPPRSATIQIRRRTAMQSNW